MQINIPGFRFHLQQGLVPEILPYTLAAPYLLFTDFCLPMMISVTTDHHEMRLGEKCDPTVRMVHRTPPRRSKAKPRQTLVDYLRSAANAPHALQLASALRPNP